MFFCPENLKQNIYQYLPVCTPMQDLLREIHGELYLDSAWLNGIWLNRKPANTEKVLSEFRVTGYTEISPSHWEHSSDKRKSIGLTKNIFKVQWSLPNVIFKQCNESILSWKFLHNSMQSKINNMLFKSGLNQIESKIKVPHWDCSFKAFGAELLPKVSSYFSYLKTLWKAPKK